jgi:hypothetical protein
MFKSPRKPSASSKPKKIVSKVTDDRDEDWPEEPGRELESKKYRQSRRPEVVHVTGASAAKARRLAAYMRHRNSVGEQILAAVLRMAASVEAAQTTNDVLQDRMGLLDVSIDVEEVVANCTTILRSEIMAILAKHAYLPKSAKFEMTERVICRMIPKRDNVSSPISTPRGRNASIARTEDLVGAMSREMDKLKKGK